MNHLLGRIALGTANFGRSYGLSGKHVDEAEQKEILAFCKEVGIDMIDTATAYGWDWTQINTDFKVVLKVTEGDLVSAKIVVAPPYCIMAHDKYTRDYLKSYGLPGPIKIGASIYDISERHDMCSGCLIQIPYSIFDRRFEPYLESMSEVYGEIHARSIFLQGAVFCDVIPEHLKPIGDKIRLIRGYDNPALACILFVLLNRNIDRVIMGVDSLKQLENNVKFFRRLDDFEVKDENILDPRKWGK